MDSEVFERIRDYLADQLDVEPEKITPESDIINDFDADSLDVIDMITTLSDEFGVEIPDEDIETFHTVGDVVDVVVLSVDEQRHRISLSMKQAKKQ